MTSLPRILFMPLLLGGALAACGDDGGETKQKECDANHYGANCDDCACEHGVCDDGRSGTGSCTCHEGWTGARCDTAAVDSCAANPCLNGGTCTNDGDGYTCVCLGGHGGPNCEIPPECTETSCENDGDDCAAAPCQNGGTCVDGVNAFTCNCPSGFTGTTCADDVDECATANPCSANALCFNSTGSFSCECTNDFSGDGLICVSDARALWRLDGNTFDASGNGFDGAAENAAFRPGWAHEGQMFDPAEGSLVRIPYINLREASFTIEAWVAPNDVSAARPVFTQCETEDTDRCLWLGISAGRALFAFGDDDSVGLSTIATGRWVHLAWVYDATTSTQRIFVDGILDGEEGSHGPYLGESGDTAIGAALEAGGTFDGGIDEVKLYARARSAAEIASDAWRVVSYDFTRGLAHDGGPNRLHGVLSSGVTAGPGVSGEALVFDSGAYVSTSGVTALGESNRAFTIEVWVNPAVAEGGTVINVDATSESSGWCAPFLGFDVDGHPAAQLVEGGAALAVTASEPVVSASWTRLTQTYSPTRGLRLYVDGELVAVNASAVTYDGTGEVRPVVITGAALGSCVSDTIVTTPFAGAVDDLSIVRVERSADDIASSQTFAHACSYLQAEHPSFTTPARDVALCGNRYLAEDIASACAPGWQVCTLSQWQARVLPEGFDPDNDPAPPINGALTSWGTPQARRCGGGFWEALRPGSAETSSDDVCADTGSSPYNPQNNGKYLFADDGETLLEGSGGCCDWDSTFDVVTAVDPWLAVYCCADAT